MTTINNLKTLYKSDLQYLYDAEKTMLNLLDGLEASASSSELRSLIYAQKSRNENHINRLEYISGDLSGNDRKVGKGMQGLHDEITDLIEKREGLDDTVLDAALISALQRIQHYEIASYGTLKTYAEMIDEDEAATVLGEILEEKKDTDETLTKIAMESVNPEALN